MFHGPTPNPDRYLCWFGRVGRETRQCWHAWEWKGQIEDCLLPEIAMAKRLKPDLLFALSAEPLPSTREPFSWFDSNRIFHPVANVCSIRSSFSENSLSLLYYQSYELAYFAFLWAIWPLGCRLVVWIFLTFYSHKGIIQSQKRNPFFAKQICYSIEK